MEFLFLWIVFGIIGFIIGNQKAMAGAGFFLGLLLGPLGWLLIFLSKGNQKTCLRCGEQVRPEATVCRYCHSELKPVVRDIPREPVDPPPSRTSAIATAIILVPLALCAGLYLAHFLTKESPAPVENPAQTPTAQREPVSLMATSPAIPSLSAASPSTPAPTSTPFDFPKAVAASQRAAVARYPELGVAGSRMNRDFLSRHVLWRQSADKRLLRPDWPERLADECAASP